jgi:hypothetical protein
MWRAAIAPRYNILIGGICAAVSSSERDMGGAIMREVLDLLPHGRSTTIRHVRPRMKLVLGDAANDELARPEQNPELREKLEKQAAVCRNVAAKRAQELMLLEQLAEFCSVNPPFRDRCCHIRSKGGNFPSSKSG